MKRFFLALFILWSWLFLIGAASAQTVTAQGWPLQGAIFKDTLFLARVAPFIIALGVIAGIVQARMAARSGGDKIIGDQVGRHDVSTVIAHWTNAVGAILGLVTGAIVLRWVNYSPELRLVFTIHYVGAALMLFAVFNHLTRHGISGGTGLLPKSLSVIRDLIGELFEYLGLFGSEGAVLRIPWPETIRRPIARYVKALLGYKEAQSDKYLATEQIISYPIWAILIGLVVVSGLIKVLRYVYVIPGSVVATSTAIHDLATIGIGVMLVMHLLPLLLVPANWTLLLSMFRGTVPRGYVEKRHPLWYKRLRAMQGRETVAEAMSVEPSPAAQPADTEKSFS